MAVSKILSALSDDTRRRVLEILKKGKISSGDLAKELDMTPQALSYHLSKLKKADLIYETVLDEAVMWIMNLRGENDDKN